MTVDRRLAICALALVVLSVPSLVRIARTIPSHASLDYNEGWNAYVADRVAHSIPLYPDPPRFFANNYPPLSFYAIGGIGPTDRIAGGRAVSMVAFLVWVVALGVAARRFGCSPVEAAFGAALFMALMLALTSYVGTNDPQLFGHALQAIALCLLSGARRSRWRIVATAVLLAAGVFVKLNLVALPLALTIWLFVIDRRTGWQLVIAGAICGIAATSLCVWTYGAGFLPQVSTVRGYSLRDTWHGTLVWLTRMPVFLALVGMLARRAPSDGPATLVAVYATISALIGLAFVGGSGVDWNVLFDANAACCLAAAVGLGRVSVERRPFVAVACMLLPAVAALAAARTEWLSPDYWIAPRAAESSDADRDVAFIRAHTGPVFCADLALCWRAGKAMEVDTFGMEQRGARDPALLEALVRLVEERYYDVIQMGPRPPRFGTRFDEALRSEYVFDHRDRYGVFLVRRATAPRPRSTRNPSTTASPSQKFSV